MNTLIITLETAEDVVDVRKLINSLNRQVKIWDERWRVEAPWGNIKLVNSPTEIVVKEANQ